jgi:hypothetical protein
MARKRSPHKENVLQGFLPLFLFVMALCVVGCAKFSEADCIQNVKDGFTWRITKVHFNKYTVQGWFDGKWGQSVDGPFSTFDSQYVKVTCPFSTQMVQEQR